MIDIINKFHKTKIGYLIFGLVELGLSYAFISLAIDRGNFVWYILALVTFVGFLKNFSKLIGKITHGSNKPKRSR